MWMQAQHRVGGGQIGTSGVRSAKCSIACTAAMDWGQSCGGTARRPVRNTFVQFNSPRTTPRGGGKLLRPMLSAFQAHIVGKLTCMTLYMPPSRRAFPLSLLGRLSSLFFELLGIDVVPSLQLACSCCAQSKLYRPYRHQRMQN
jgi:hypothetical protein